MRNARNWKEWKEMKKQKENEDTQFSKFIKNIKDTTKHDEVESAICVVKHNDGTVVTVTTDADDFECLGLLEFGKLTLYEDRNIGD